MCVIAFVEEDQVLDRETLSKMFKANPDGAGLVVYKKGRWILRKGIMDFENLIEIMKKYSLFKKYHRRFIIHMRKVSCGTVCEEQTHPFTIELSNNLKAYLFHNGTLETEREFKYNNTLYVTSGLKVPENKSDTQVLCEKISELKLSQEQLISLLQKGGLLSPLLDYSRLCIAFQNSPKPLLIGEWKKYKGIRVSNVKFKDVVKSTENVVSIDKNDESAYTYTDSYFRNSSYYNINNK